MIRESCVFSAQDSPLEIEQRLCATEIKALVAALDMGYIHTSRAYIGTNDLRAKDSWREALHGGGEGRFTITITERQA